MNISIKRYVSMAVIALMGSVIMGCSENDLVENAPQNKVVTLTTTISLDGSSATTRALNANGKKTFAADEQIALIYESAENGAQKVISAKLKAENISSDKKTASFSFTFEKAPKDNGNFTMIYPASMAKEPLPSEGEFGAKASPAYTKLATQDGTLESLSSNLDLAYYESNFTNATFPSGIQLSNKLAILEFTSIKNYDGSEDLTSTITGLTVKVGTGASAPTYTVARTAADGPIYVALESCDSKDITIIATTSTANYEKTVTSQSLAASTITPVTAKIWKVVDVSTLTIPDGENYVGYTAQNGDMLTGTIANRVLICIAANANVALKNLTIDYEAPPGSSFYFHNPGITCKGNATIILEGTNKVKAFEGDFPGIRAATNGSANDYTLTIKGDGSLEAIGQMGGAGIGGCNGGNCGNIVIESGSITATGGNNAAGIGSGYRSSCGNILISGGTVKATGGNNAAGIGTGDYGTCGSITITNGVKEVIANRGTGAVRSIGKGNGDSSCGKVTILGVEYWNGSGYVNDECRIYLQDPDLKIIP